MFIKVGSSVLVARMSARLFCGNTARNSLTRCPSALMFRLSCALASWMRKIGCPVNKPSIKQIISAKQQY